MDIFDNIESNQGVRSQLRQIEERRELVMSTF